MECMSVHTNMNMHYHNLTTRDCQARRIMSGSLDGDKLQGTTGCTPFTFFLFCLLSTDLKQTCQNAMATHYPP